MLFYVVDEGGSDLRYPMIQKPGVYYSSVVSRKHVSYIRKSVLNHLK